MPRQGVNMVELDFMSVVELYHVHVASAENTQGVSVSDNFTELLPNFLYPLVWWDKYLKQIFQTVLDVVYQDYTSLSTLLLF